MVYSVRFGHLWRYLLSPLFANQGRNHQLAKPVYRQITKSVSRRPLRSLYLQFLVLQLNRCCQRKSSRCHTLWTLRHKQVRRSLHPEVRLLHLSFCTCIVSYCWRRISCIQQYGPELRWTGKCFLLLCLHNEKVVCHRRRNRRTSGLWGDRVVAELPLWLAN